MYIKLLKVLFGSSILFFTGCAGISGKFDCPFKPGVCCKSVSEVNDLVDRGKLPTKPKTKTIITGNTTATPIVANKETTVTQFKGAKRVPEKILTVWLAPFVDQAGHYHAGSYLTAVIRSAKWI